MRGSLFTEVRTSTRRRKAVLEDFSDGPSSLSSLHKESNVRKHYMLLFRYGVLPAIENVQRIIFSVLGKGIDPPPE